MSSITDLLAAILAAKKGEEVRGSIHDAIELCYQDGKAGASDLQARQLIEAVAEVNEQQQAALEVLQARVEELEQGGGESSQQSTTIDIPTVLVDGGVVESLNVNNNGTTTHHITFTTPFTEAPKVMVAIGKNAGAVSQYGYLSANILYPTITTTGFDVFLANRTGSDRSPGVVWYAYQPTVKTIDLDITIPETEGMTEAQVREITGPISAAVDAIKTGYDGTVYQTAAEAIRTQINDLHVLIGDEPGTAIDASAIGYGEDSNVEDALDGLNGRLEELEQSGGSGANVPTEVRQAIYTLLTKGLYSDTGLTDEKAVLQSWATEVTGITISQSSISISGATTSQLTATTSPAGGLVTWSSSNPAVATVSSNGLVTGVSNGTATITASCGGKKATCTATVTGFATLTGITAVYSGGSVYDTATLNDLKSDLVVTASYDNSTTATVTDYTLSGSLAIGTNTITVSYGGFTDTFNVTVTQDLTGMLYSFDFRNNNLTDDVNGVVAVTNATQGANGISFTAGQQYIVLDTSTTRSLAGLRVEIDIASMSDSSDTSGNYHARLFSVTTNSSYATHNGADNFLWRKGGIGWYFYNGGWSSEYIDPVSYPGSYFSGKTVSLEFDSAGYCTVSVDGTELVTYGIKTTRTGYFVIGGANSDYMSILSPTISAVRVYEVAA